MADTLETMEKQEPEVADGLARTISVAGLVVSQAADELQQAAERLMNADEQVREAELRWRAADEQMAQAATKNAELLDMLQSAREGQTEAEERCRRAEQRLQVAIDRTRLMEEQIAALQGRLEEAEAKPHVTVIVDDERTALQEVVAAEVRRPLTSILGLTLALKHADPKSSEGKDMVKQLATNARKLDRLIGEMLDLDKIASGNFTPNRRRTDIEALVRRVIEESPDLANRDVKVEAEHVALEVDPALTEQMVETLLANAGRRTAPGNPVRVSISSDQAGVVIAVDDTGPEVPPGQRDALFAALSDDGPGTRQRKPKGAMGLSLLARLAEIHGGRAWVEERQGGGASFRVFLSAAKRGDETVEDPADAPARDLSDERGTAPAGAAVPEERDEEVLDTAIATNGQGALADSGGLPDEISI